MSNDSKIGQKVVSQNLLDEEKAADGKSVRSRESGKGSFPCWRRLSEKLVSLRVG